jgi:uncharacterized membrane protein YkvA (DUF1232 family)
MENKDLNDILEKEEIEFDELDFGGQAETENKIDYVEGNLWTKLEKVGKKISFAKDIMALFNYMRDDYVSWHRKAIVVAALIYFISPIDTIPDIAPLFGYLDDLGVITALLKYLGSELMPYYGTGYRS